MMQPRHTIMVNSHATRAALMEYVIYKQQNSAAGMAELATAPIGVEAIFRTGRPPAWPSAQPYFVCVATIEPRKNHVFLLQLWQRLVALLGDAAPRLVLVGRRGWENENAIDMLERGHGMRDAVLECGALPDRLMAALIAGARAVLLPSLAEGFGLPVVEALALGTPVIASDLPALREIGGGIPEFLDPLDGRGWLAALHDYAQPDSPRRERQISALQKYRAPCWDQHFQAFDALARGASQPAAVLAPALC
jgi:glycosyltransferase involved in cell wall biosynthesis